MFCKWCGGNLAAGDMKCKRCGREVTPKSDCGGFYDLVREERTAPQPVLQTSAPQAKSPVGLIIGMAAGFAVVLILLVVQFVNQSKLTQELENLRSEIEELTVQAATEESQPGDGAAEGTETITITLPELFGQDEEKEVTEGLVESEV